MGEEPYATAMTIFYIVAFVCLLIISVAIQRDYNHLIQFLQEDWPEKWLALSNNALTMKILYQAIFRFIWQGRVFKSVRIALMVKRLRETYTALFVVGFVVLLVFCWFTNL